MGKYDELSRKIHKRNMDDEGIKSDNKNDVFVDPERAYQERLDLERKLITKLNLDPKRYPLLEKTDPKHEEMYLCLYCFFQVAKDISDKYGDTHAIIEAERYYVKERDNLDGFFFYGCELCLWHHKEFSNATIRVVISDTTGFFEAEKSQLKIYEKLLVKKILDEA